MSDPLKNHEEASSKIQEALLLFPYEKISSDRTPEIDQEKYIPDIQNRIIKESFRRSGFESGSSSESRKSEDEDSSGESLSFTDQNFKSFARLKDSFLKPDSLLSRDRTLSQANDPEETKVEESETDVKQTNEPIYQPQNYSTGETKDTQNCIPPRVSHVSMDQTPSDIATNKCCSKCIIF